MSVNVGSGNGLGAIREQAIITWANADQDLGRHMASLGHNELGLRQNDSHFSNKIFICIFLDENFDRTKPLPEPMLTKFLISYVITRLQWVQSLKRVTAILY